MRKYSYQESTAYWTGRDSWTRQQYRDGRKLAQFLYTVARQASWNVDRYIAWYVNNYQVITALKTPYWVCGFASFVDSLAIRQRRNWLKHNTLNVIIVPD